MYHQRDQIATLSTAHPRLTTRLHSSSGIVGDWVSGRFFGNQHSLHSHNLSCYRHVSQSALAKTSIRDQGIYLSLYQFSARSHSAVTQAWQFKACPRRTFNLGLWTSLATAASGLWSIVALVIRTVVHQSIFNGTVVPDSNRGWVDGPSSNVLEPTHAFQHSTSAKHGASLPVHGLVTPGSHSVSFWFIYAAKVMHGRAGLGCVSSLAWVVFLMYQLGSPLNWWQWWLCPLLATVCLLPELSIRPWIIRLGRGSHRQWWVNLHVIFRVGVGWLRSLVLAVGRIICPPFSMSHSSRMPISISIMAWPTQVPWSRGRPLWSIPLWRIISFILPGTIVAGRRMPLRGTIVPIFRLRLSNVAGPLRPLAFTSVGLL